MSKSFTRFTGSMGLTVGFGLVCLGLFDATPGALIPGALLMLASVMLYIIGEVR